MRGERRKKEGRIEWRLWNPTKSKVAASILRTKQDPREIIPNPGSTCLYLGASGGGTVSHIHDIVCGSGNHLSGQVVAVEISPRMTRDLASLSVNRSGLIPIMGDARKTEVIAPFIRSKADWIHQDLSITDQAETFVNSIMHFLSDDGIGLLSLKAASERYFDGDVDSRFMKAEEVITSSELDLIERIDLRGLEEQHVVYICKLNQRIRGHN